MRTCAPDISPILENNWINLVGLKDYDYSREDVEVVEWADPMTGLTRCATVPKPEYSGKSPKGIVSTGCLERLEADPLFRDRAGLGHATAQEIKRRTMERDGGNKRIVA